MIDLIVGARPNFVKIASIIRALKLTPKNKLSYRLVHTGQHYDSEMSEVFFNQLDIPQPDRNLQSGSGTQAEQTARIMIAYEKLLNEKKCDLCLVVGDVNSTLACAITAKKFMIKVAHVEAGIRSHDLSMAEEINRVVTDSITDFFFTTSDQANENLLNMGVSGNKIFFVGNTMIDTLMAQSTKFIKPKLFDELFLKQKDYFVLTLHRAGNVDQEDKLKCQLLSISKLTRGLPVIFPVHPRTKKSLVKTGLDLKNFNFIAPLSYLEFNYLVKNCKAVITDSGGITEECTVMAIPCFTIRNNTERPETVTLGTNELIGTDPKKFDFFFDKLFSNSWKQGSIPPLWDGLSGERIICHLQKLLD